MSVGFIISIVFSSMSLLLIVFLVRNLQRNMKIRIDQARTDLERQGYVTDQSFHRPLGELTRFWGRYSQPVGLYVQVSNMDPVAIAAGNLGIADIKLGSPAFDSSFVVRSNDTSLAKMIFDAELLAALMIHENIRFRTGSLDNLLGADYFPELKTGRDLRSFWMLEKAGKFEGTEAAELLALGRLIEEKVKQLGQGSGQNIKSSVFEGR